MMQIDQLINKVSTGLFAIYHLIGYLLKTYKTVTHFF